MGHEISWQTEISFNLVGLQQKYTSGYDRKRKYMDRYPRISVVYEGIEFRLPWVCLPCPIPHNLFYGPSGLGICIEEYIILGRGP